MPTKTVDRYPGPFSYEDTPEHHRLFSGRDQDIRSLTYQIVACRLLVVFGQSGLGKTSLLQAGVFPKLREEDLFPVSIRLNGSVPPLQLIASRCEATSREFGIDYSPGIPESAWEFFKTAMFWRRGALVSPVLVFDQFEEIFTLIEPAWRKEFAKEIGSLVSGSPPAAIRERLKGDTRITDLPPKVKTVLSLREEWYGSLEELSANISGMFQDRFQLLPLSIDQAREAIEKPATALPDGTTDFSTRPFRYDPSALQMMLDFLKGRFDKIEPFQLQLLCQDVEQRVVKKKDQQQATGSAQDAILILSQDLGGEQAMATVLRRFYQHSLEELPVQQRFRARELCDTGLLSPGGHRLMLQADQIHRDFGVTKNTLECLAKKRILREVPRLESIFYEISHDRLAQSILKARRRRIPRKYRIPAAVASSFLVVVLMYIVSTNVLLRAERDKATNAQEASEHARKGAEQLASYLIGEDLMESVRPMGRLSVLKGLEERVDKYLESTKGQPADNLTLQIKGLAYLNRGDIAYQQYELTKAQTEYSQAREIFRTLSIGSAPKAESFHSLAAADAKLAAIAADQLRLTDAINSFNSALAALDESWRAYDREPASAGRSASAAQFEGLLLRDRADFHQQIGSILNSQGRYTEALQHFDQTLQLAPVTSESPHWLYIRQEGLGGKRTALSQQGHDQAAQDAAQAAINCAKRTATLSPFEPMAQFRVANAQHDLAELQADKHPELLFPVYVKIHNIIEEMIKWDPDNKNWQRQYAATIILLGGGYAFNKHDELRARRSYEDAEKKLIALEQIDSTNHSLDMDFVWLYRDWGDALYRFNPEEALTQYDKALAILDRLRHIDSTNRDIYNFWSYVVIQKCESLRSNGRYGEALRLFKEVSPTMELNKPVDPTDVTYWLSLERLHGVMAYTLILTGDSKGAARQYAAATTSGKRAAETAGSNARYWADVGDYYGRLSDVEESKNEEGVLAAKREGLKALEKAAKIDPGKSSDLASGYRDLGDVLRDNREYQGAITAYEKSRQTLLAAISTADDKKAIDYRTDLFDLLCNQIAPIQAQLTNKAAMLPAYDEAAAVAQTGFQSGARTAEADSKLALAYETIGKGLRDHGELKAANDYYSRADKVWRDAIALKPDAKYRNSLFVLLCERTAPLQAQQNNKAGMLQTYEEAAALAQTVFQAGDRSADAYSKLASAYEAIGDGLKDHGELIVANDYYSRAKKGEEQAYRRALEAAKSAVDLTPSDAELHTDVAKAYWRIGQVLQEQGNLSDAKVSFEMSDRELNEAMGLKSGYAVYFEDRYVLLDTSMAPLLVKQGDRAAALEAYQQGLTAINKAVELQPKNDKYRQYAGLAQEHIGDMATSEQQHITQALQSYGKAEQEFRQAIALTKNDPKETAGYWNEVYTLLVKVAPLRAGQGDMSGANQAYREARKAIAAAEELDPHNSIYREKRAEIDTKVNSSKPE